MIHFLVSRFLRTALLPFQGIGPVWRPRVSGEFSFPRSVTISALPLLECSLGKSQWTLVTFSSVERTVCRSERVKVQAVVAALAWCHVANLEVKDVTIRPDSMYAIGVLDRSRRSIYHVRLVRATRRCLEKERSKCCVTFKHTKAHECQWAVEAAADEVKRDQEALNAAMRKQQDQGETRAASSAREAGTMLTKIWNRDDDSDLEGPTPVLLWRDPYRHTRSKSSGCTAGRTDPSVCGTANACVREGCCRAHNCRMR